MGKNKLYIVKLGHTIKHNGVEYNEGQDIELTEAEAEKLHVESADQHKARQVLEGNDSYADTPAPNTKVLLAKIAQAKSEETVEALMSLSTVKSVITAGNKRLKELSEEAAALSAAHERSGDPQITMDALKLKIRDAKDIKALEALSGDVINWKNPEEASQLTDAYDAREKELKG